MNLIHNLTQVSVEHHLYHPNQSHCSKQAPTFTEPPTTSTQRQHCLLKSRMLFPQFNFCISVNYIHICSEKKDSSQIEFIITTKTFLLVRLFSLNSAAGSSVDNITYWIYGNNNKTLSESCSGHKDRSRIVQADTKLLSAKSCNKLVTESKDYYQTMSVWHILERNNKKDQWKGRWGRKEKEERVSCKVNQKYNFVTIWTFL